MNTLPVISGKKLLRVFMKNGYIALRQKGSHVFLESADGLRGTVVPVHGNEDLGTGLLKSILNDLNLDVKDFAKMLKRKK